MKFVIRWSVVTAAAIALFWSVWWLAAGEVPVITSIRMTPTWSVEMPFAVSRWWDILIGPIWSALLILTFTARIGEDEDSRVGLAYGLVVGLGFGLAYGLVVGLGFGLAYVLRKLFSLESWRTVGRWLCAKDG